MNKHSKSEPFRAVSCLLYAAVIVTIMSFSLAGSCATDATLNVGPTRAGQNVILNWGSAGGVPYQVEASSTLADWTNVSPVITGTGSQLSFTNSMTGQSRRFFRVKRVFPAAPGTAVYNPVTGLLTIVGDALHTFIDVENSGTGVISINGGAIPITGGVATPTNTVLIQILGSPGNDQITFGNSLPPAHIFGGEGNDILTGGGANDLIVTGSGNNTVTGGRGSDIIRLGAGTNIVIWNPGDGSDTIDGQGGSNTLVLNGANVGEIFTLSANGPRLRLFRDVGNVTMDVNGVQTVNIQALGGADNVTVSSLAGTSVKQVNIDLGAAGGSGDGQPDSVTINGTTGPDTFNIAANGGAVEVTGLGALVRVTNAELANDRIVVNGVGGDTVNVNGTAGADTMQVLLSPVSGYARVFVSGFTAPVDVAGALTLSVNGLGGPDTITAGNGLAALGIPMILDGGDGDNTIVGGDENDTIITGSGNNTVSGGRGSDIIRLGAGTNVVIWNPGDGSDTIDGQGGSNTLVFNGANISENFTLSANGPRLRLFRDVGNVTMDVNGAQTVNIQALGGADNVTVNSLAGTSVKQVNIDLGAAGGSGDGQPDSVTINGTTGPDIFNLTASAGVVGITGLPAQVQITHSELVNDTLIINELGGTDALSIGPGVTTQIGLIVNH